MFSCISYRIFFIQPTYAQGSALGPLQRTCADACCFSGARPAVREAGCKVRWWSLLRLRSKFWTLLLASRTNRIPNVKIPFFKSGAHLDLRRCTRRRRWDSCNQAGKGKAKQNKKWERVGAEDRFDPASATHRALEVYMRLTGGRRNAPRNQLSASWCTARPKLKLRIFEFGVWAKQILKRRWIFLARRLIS